MSEVHEPTKAEVKAVSRELEAALAQIAWREARRRVRRSYSRKRA